MANNYGDIESVSGPGYIADPPLLCTPYSVHSPHALPSYLIHPPNGLSGTTIGLLAPRRIHFRVHS